MRDLLFGIVAVFSSLLLRAMRAATDAVAVASGLLLRLIDSRRWTHSSALADQGEELEELDLLFSALRLKRAVTLEGGRWKPRHGEGLEPVATGLLEVHDWSREDVGRLLEELTDGVYTINDDGDEADD